MYMQKFVDGGPAQQVTQFQPTFSPAQQGLGSIQQAPDTPAMESSPTDYNQFSQPTQQYSAPAAKPMTAGLGSYLQGLEYKAPVAPTPPPINTGATGLGGGAWFEKNFYDLLRENKTGDVSQDKLDEAIKKSSWYGKVNDGSGNPYTAAREVLGLVGQDIRGNFNPPASAGDPDAARQAYMDRQEAFWGRGAEGKTPSPVASPVASTGGTTSYDPSTQTYSANPLYVAPVAPYDPGEGGSYVVGDDGSGRAGGRVHSYAQGGSIPQGIASLGRGQDSMLVHMTPGEVGGLQQLAMAHGGSLTINPQTGLPEAGFLSSLLPAIAGIGLNLAFPGAGAALIGAGVGGVAALTSGSLKKGLMAGLGAYGGAGLGSSLSSMGAEQAQGLQTAETAASADLAGKQAYDRTLSTATSDQAKAIAESAGDYTQTLNPPKLTNSLFDENGAPWGDRTPTTYMEPGVDGPITPKPAPTFLQNPTEMAEAARRQAIDETSLNYKPEADGAAGKALARGPAGNAFQGIQQLGTKEGLKTLGGKLGFSGVASLAAPFLSSAMEPGKFNPPANRPSQYYNTSYNPPRYNPQTGTYEPASYGPGSYSTAYAAQGGAVGYDEGGIARFYPLTGDRPNTGGIGGDGEKPKYSREINAPDSGAGISDNKAGRGVYSDTGGINANTPSGLEGLFAKTSAATLAKHLKSKSAALQAEARAESFRRANAVADYADDTISAAQGGLMGLNTYAAGGKLLRGPGDGMSDSIPAVITGAKPQRAALADGEFVIPADVVSHLGNGSTEAGSKRLYSMMDKVRSARTGNPKQGKQINPDRFMPA